MKKNLLLLVAIFILYGAGYSQYTKNYAAFFGATNSYVAVPNKASLNPNFTFTIEAWVNPQNVTLTTMTIVGKSYQTSYYLGIQTSGRVVFYPKGSSSLRSSVSRLIPEGKWTHIAATYNGSITSIYINGALDTFTSAITGGITNNPDSLLIGADKFGNSNILFFNGMLDNVRIWNTARTQSEIIDNMFIPLTAGSTGVYSPLVASFQFDNNVYDFSGNPNNDGFARNISYVNFSNKSINHADYNNSLYLNGTNAYCSHRNSPSFNSTSEITLESWIKRDTTGAQPVVMKVVNVSGGTLRYAYSLFIHADGKVLFGINSGNYLLLSTPRVTSSQWTHIAATYSAYSGKAVIYVNGDSVAGDTFFGNPAIQSFSSDSLFIGGIGASNFSAYKFKGQIDEVRIWNKGARSGQQIKDNMFRSIRSAGTADSLVYFNFDTYQDGYQFGSGGGLIGILLYRGGAFVSSVRASNQSADKHSSPMFDDSSPGFNSKAFTFSNKRFYVPDVNAVRDSIYVSEGDPVNNLKVLLMISHSAARDLRISLISPNGTSILLFNQKGSLGNDIMTCLSDDNISEASSDNFVSGSKITAPFSPGIKPEAPLSTFNGQSRKGWWKLKIEDLQFGNTGYVHSWGINVTSQIKLSLTAVLQGLYYSAENEMIKDTVTVLLRNTAAPYTIADSAKALLDSSGKGSFNFPKAVLGSSYYITVKHRNSIETWSSLPKTFSSDTASYNFTVSPAAAFGNNLKLVNTSPAVYAIYSGDVNQDAVIDLTDIVLVNNDASVFLTGYKVTDINGDRISDLTDLLIAHNNSSNFVSVKKPEF